MPVVQLSMPSLDRQGLLALGQQLRALREEGFLVIGSGFMTHSFAVMRNLDLVAHNRALDTWAADALTRGDVDTLTNYQTNAPSARIAHPTADHYVPRLLTLGAATDPSTARSAIDRIWYGNFIRSIQVT